MQTIYACEYFGVKATQVNQGNYTGEVFLKKALDYELRKGFTMTIQAKVCIILQNIEHFYVMHG